MKDQNIDVLYGNCEVTFKVPSTVEESDNLIGAGETLNGSNSDIMYRNTLPRFYKAVSKALVDDGYAKQSQKNKDGSVKTTTKADKSVVEVSESDIEHIERVRAEGDAELQTKIGDLLRSTATSFPFYAEGARGGSGKLPQAILDAVEPFFVAGPDSVENAVANLEKAVPGYKVMRDSDGAVTRESLARGVQALNKKIEADAKKSALATLQAAA